MKVSDLAIGVGLVGLGLAVFVYGLLLPPMPGQRYGAGLFPILLGICFVGAGAHLAKQGWRERRTYRTPLAELPDWARDPRLASNLALVLVAILVYVLLSERIGFIPLSIAILMTLFWRLRVHLGRGLVIAVVATLFIQVAFADLLRVPLPRGLLDRVLW